MTDSYDDRIAAAHAAVADRERITQRIADAQEDRERLLGDLREADQEITTEQAELARVRRVFLKLTQPSDHKRQEQPLAALKLQREALAEELRATEYYLAQLAARAAEVKDADLELEAMLAEKEVHVRMDPGPAGAKLADIAERERTTRLARREVAEALTAGYAAHRALITTTASVDAAQLGAMRRALVTFQRECADVTGTTPCVAVTPLTCVVALVARDVTWSSFASDVDVTTELAAVTSLVGDCLSALRERDAQLDRGLDRLARERTAVVDNTAT